MNEQYLEFLRKQCVEEEEVEIRKTAAGTFAGVQPRHKGTREPARVCWFVVDLDNPQEGDLEQTKKLRPNILVNSGRGYHLYFLLAHPVALSDKSVRDQVQQRNRAALLKLEDRFKGDIGVSVNDPERCMRIPGTINPKPGCGKVAELLLINEGLNENFNRWYGGLRVERLDEATGHEREGIREDFQARLNAQCSAPGKIQDIWLGNRPYDSES